jgi:hypothetical protein
VAQTLQLRVHYGHSDSAKPALFNLTHGLQTARRVCLLCYSEAALKSPESISSVQSLSKRSARRSKPLVQTTPKEEFTGPQFRGGAPTGGYDNKGTLLGTPFAWQIGIGSIASAVTGIGLAEWQRSRGRRLLELFACRFAKYLAAAGYGRRRKALGSQKLCCFGS